MQITERADGFNIKIAGIVIRIEPLYAFVQVYCKDYLSEETEHFTVRIEPEDIRYEQEKSEAEDKRAGNPIREFSESYLETLAVYRKICAQLLKTNIILFHGSAIAVDGKAYLFTAKSGTGKSTHTRLWREQFGTRAVMVNDDKPLLQLMEDQVLVHGTPWTGKHNLGTNCAVPLKAICEIKRAETNQIKEVSGREIYSILLQQVYRPGNPEEMMQTMRYVDALMERVRFYQLRCNMEPEAALVSYNGMQGE